MSVVTKDDKATLRQWHDELQENVDYVPAYDVVKR